MEPQTRTRDAWLVAGMCLALAIAILAVYGQIVKHDFIGYDDPMHISEDPHILAGLTKDGTIWAFTTTMGGNWIPLTSLSHMLVVEIYGPDPAAHLLANVLLHTATSVLLLILLYRLTKRPWPSAIAAALFALHPLHVESVAWVTERKDVLSALFLVLTLQAYSWYTARPSLKRYGLVALLLLLGLMAKSMLVTLPFLLLLLDYWPLGRLSGDAGTGSKWWRLIVEKAPLFALVAAVSVATYLSQKSVGTIDIGGSAPLLTRATNISSAFGMYMRQTFWPFGLSVFYPPIPSDELLTYSMLGICVGGLGLAASLWMLRRRPYVAVGWFWFIGMLVPVIGFIRIGAHGHADRYTYLPHIGLFILIAWAAADAANRSRGLRITLSTFAVVLIVAFSIRTSNQVGYWKNDKALFGHAIKVTTRNAPAHNMYALALMEEQDFLNAAHHFEKAAEFNPEKAKYRHNFGLSQMLLGKDEAAIETFYATLELDPPHAATHYRLGLLLLRNDQLPAAAQQFTNLIAVDPDHVDARLKLALTYARIGRLDEAERYLLEAIELDPANANAHFDYASFLSQNGRVPEAIEQFRHALNTRPMHAGTHRQLAILLQLTGQPGLAQEHLARATQLETNPPTNAPN